jgi:hypothetical protein
VLTRGQFGRAGNQRLGLVEQRVPPVQPVEVYHLIDPRQGYADHRIDAIRIERQGLPE